MTYGLPAGTRFVFDQARQQYALLEPEGVRLLNETAAAIVEAAGDPAVLAAWFDSVDETEVASVVAELLTQGGTRPVPQTAPATPGHRPEPTPFGLLAELTYRCPLRCPYCSNPVDPRTSEVDTGTWLRVIDEARELGVLQLHLSGGEPLARRDLTEIVRHAATLSIYTNLVTSGIGLTAQRLASLRDAGLDHVQLSIQDSRAPEADTIAGIKAHERKRAVAKMVCDGGLPLSVNVVLHRHNVDRLAEIASYAASLGAQRIELAHTQYYGWGLLNRQWLLPSRDQVERAEAAAAQAMARSDGVDIVYVRPDYYDGVPKPCMNGWGSRQLVVTPSGDVLPCPAASVLPDLLPGNVLDSSLADIWYSSDAFNRFRGTSWMPQPCRSCPRKEVDFGGCRCQAFQLTGDPAATDPACALSPQHDRVVELVAAAAAPVSLPVSFLPRRLS
ncbi:MAG TPA: pyrroloquinoline quinone biosynthesis protein PqqE [Candidatus Limnocylindrales bacterium]|nr:pyrroloquinoline quinone biosynthesis protein PqqE [Candidatus Limnocylindrales bacterium]